MTKKQRQELLAIKRGIEKHIPPITKIVESLRVNLRMNNMPSDDSSVFSMLQPYVAAIVPPSGVNEFMWRFIMLSEEELRELCSLDNPNGKGFRKAA